MSGKCSCIYNLRHDSHFFEAFNKTKVASREVASSIAFSDSGTGELWYNYSCIGGPALSVIGVNYVSNVLLPCPGPPIFPGKVWVNIIWQTAAGRHRGEVRGPSPAHLLLVQMELFWTMSVTTTIAPYSIHCVSSVQSCYESAECMQKVPTCWVLSTLCTSLLRIVRHVVIT